ncbi:hypothetical protein C8R45DRAFT_1096966 [Mycena sanguinolenta]|nr:hypothetical protein C8R45DRAFT_1096966 [Mycena sanguinolenta]
MINHFHGINLSRFEGGHHCFRRAIDTSRDASHHSLQGIIRAATLTTLADSSNSKSTVRPETGRALIPASDSKNAIHENYLHFNLAPLFCGSPDPRANVCASLQAVMTETMRTLANVPPQDHSWEKVLKVMMENPFLEPDAVGFSRADKLIKEDINYFQTVSSRDDTFFKESTRTDIGVVARMMASTGTTIDSLPALIYDEQSHDRKKVEVGVLRYSFSHNPRIIVYNIHLTAWSNSRRILFSQKYQNGVTGAVYANKHDYPYLVSKVAPIMIAMDSLKAMKMLPPNLVLPWVRYVKEWANVLQKHAIAFPTERRTGSHTLRSGGMYYHRQNDCASWAQVLVTVLQRLGAGVHVLRSLDEVFTVTAPSCCVEELTTWRHKIDVAIAQIPEFSTFL